MKTEFNLKIVYPSDLFYKTHKISQKDLLEKLRELKAAAKSSSNGDEKAEEIQKVIMDLFSDESFSGRRGVKTLKDAIALVKKKVA